MVAPYSGAMFAIVAWSESARLLTPGPKNSTNLPTTPFFLSISVTVRTRSVAVTPCERRPVSLNPMDVRYQHIKRLPEHAGLGFYPPTPQPMTLRPFIMVVWESVPTRVSG